MLQRIFKRVSVLILRLVLPQINNLIKISINGFVLDLIESLLCVCKVVKICFMNVGKCINCKKFFCTIAWIDLNKVNAMLCAYKIQTIPSMITFAIRKGIINLWGNISTFHCNPETSRMPFYHKSTLPYRFSKTYSTVQTYL